MGPKHNYFSDLLQECESFFIPLLQEPRDAWKVSSKLCCSHKRILLLSPLLLLTIFVMAITLPLSLPPSSMDRRSSRALSSAGGFSRSGPRVAEPPTAYLDPLTHIHSGTGKESHRAFRNVGDDERNSIKDRSHSGWHRNEQRNKDGGSSIRKVRQSNSHHLPRISISRPSSHQAQGKYTAHHPERRRPTTVPPDNLKTDRRAADRQAVRWWDEHKNKNEERQIHGSHTRTKLKAEKHKQETKSFENAAKAVKKSPLDPKKDRYWSQALSERKKEPRLSGLKTEEARLCESFQEFLEGDGRRNRTSDLPWFSQDDVQKMELLAEGKVVSKARVLGHGQVLQVALDPPLHLQTSVMRDSGPPGAAELHSQRCQQGCCSLLKRTDDWLEVFAFHLDRVLGLNRSLPAVLRSFHSDLLPYRYTSGTPRPAVWWDPDIQHLSDTNNDQNSVALGWLQYQQLLQAHCGSQTHLSAPPCVGVQHSEWGRLTIFDFLLQVNDRLDRYCCGFTPDPAEHCMENRLQTKCGSTKDLLLVHILVRKADPSRLVFIDNAGRPQQSTDNLNFRLIEGIDEFPEKAVSVLRSGCLESLLLRSLYTDREFWATQGGAAGLRPLIHIVQQRGNLLLQHIRDKKLQLKSDL